MSFKDEFLSLRKQVIEKRFSALNDQQREAVLSCHGASLILAGAGSGKTTVIVNRILNLLEFGDAYESDWIAAEPTGEDVQELKDYLAGSNRLSERVRLMLHSGRHKPWNILAITFTNKAADQLKERIVRSVGPDGNDVFASTFHSACVRFLRRDATRLGWPQNFTIYDTDDSERVIKDIYKSFSIDDKVYSVRWMSSVFGRIKDAMMTGEEYAASHANDPRTQVILRVYEEYQKRLRDAGAFDFDDLIYFTVRLLEENPDVRQYYQQRFHYVMVDEYQDTSHAQYRLVRLLTNEDNNIFVVGDDDQSIYSFRGATIDNILNFESDFAPAKVIRLEENYRSTGNILACANSVIRNNRGRKGKELWTTSGEGKKVEIHVAENESDEVAFVASSISSHKGPSDRFSSHAVLYRTNAQSAPVESYFARAGIPYKVVGALRFFDRAEIKDILSYLSVLVNPMDDLRLRRIINKPSRKIGDTTLDRISEIAMGIGTSMMEVIRHCEDYPSLSRSAPALKGFVELMDRLQEAYHTNSLGDFTDLLLDLTGYRAMLVAMGFEGEGKLENVNEFVSTVRNYEKENPEGDLAAFLEELALVSSMDAYDENADSVSLMTVHSAKGLEFDYVYLIGMEEGLFPFDRARYSEAEMEEERRLAYVAMTRAKKELYLIRAQVRMLYGSTRRNAPSRFVEEADPGTTEESGNTYQPKTYLSGDYGKANARINSGKVSGFGTPIKSAPAKEIRPKFQPNTDRFQPGDRVQHKMFGFGWIRSATPIGGDVLLEIDFDSHGRKKAMANYAPMNKVEE